VTLTVALAQPVTAHGEHSQRENLKTAARYAEEAAANGAQILCFPESFPGAWRMPVTWTPVAELCALAEKNNLHVIGSFAEPLDEDGRRCYQSVSLIGPTGKELGRYRRTIPALNPWIYRGGPLWDFDWVQGVQLPVIATDVGNVGLLVCSEVYAPELSRILALKGADIVFMPNGFVPARRGLFDTWRTLMWARAIENLFYTVTSSNLPGPSEEGLAMVCSPEDIVLETHGEGLHYAVLDLNRLAWLREQTDERGSEPPWRTKPGALRDWRRQAIFDANPVLTAPLHTKET
jgi:predicted amidohydrolase